jgi:hypothetical protein
VAIRRLISVPVVLGSFPKGGDRDPAPLFAKGVADRLLVWLEAIRADLRRAQDALANVLDKVICGGPVALADAIGEDGAACVLADECPELIMLQPAGANADEAAIVQLGAAPADLKGELADRFAVRCLLGVQSHGCQRPQ